MLGNSVRSFTYAILRFETSFEQFVALFRWNRELCAAQQRLGFNSLHRKVGCRKLPFFDSLIQERSLEQLRSI